MDILKFSECSILVVGDLMIDEYLWGEVDRISPEAPVQVVAVQNEEFTLGGCGNVVNNLVAMLHVQPYAAVMDGDQFMGLITRSDVLNYLRKQV